MKKILAMLVVVMMFGLCQAEEKVSRKEVDIKMSSYQRLLEKYNTTRSELAFSQNEAMGLKDKLLVLENENSTLREALFSGDSSSEYAEISPEPANQDFKIREVVVEKEVEVLVVPWWYWVALGAAIIIR